MTSPALEAEQRRASFQARVSGLKPLGIRAQLSRYAVLASLVVLAVVLYSLPGLLAHWHFRSNYDLAIFDQAVWHVSRLGPPASTVRGYSNLLGDHFSPILAAIAPLYWVAPGPEMLIILQAVLFAASIFPVWAFLRRRLAPRQTLALSLSYVFFWGLQRAAAYDFHEIAFAPLLIALVVLAVDARQFALLWGAAGALALVKEDLIPFLICVGVLLVVRRERRHGVGLLVGSLAAFVVVVGLVVPAFHEHGLYNFTGVYREALARPLMVPLTLVTPPVKAMTVLMWLAPFAFLPLFSPLVLLAVPFALARFLSASPSHWGTAFHYSAPLAPILVMAAGDGLARLASRMTHASYRRWFLRGVPVVAILLSLVLPGRQPAFRLFRSGQFTETPFLASGRRALALVPPDASVVAQAAIAPHLTHRQLIFNADTDTPDAEFVIAASGLSPWPLRDEAALQRFVEDRQRSGYQTVFQENGWIVLRREVRSGR